MLAVAVFEALLIDMNLLFSQAKETESSNGFINKNIKCFVHFSNGGCHYANDQHDDNRR